MKKIISIILALVTVLSCAAYSVSATETTDANKRRLELFTNYCIRHIIEPTGKPDIYMKESFYSSILDADAVLKNPDSTSEDYLNAYYNSKNLLYNSNIYQKYAWKSYEKASKLQNVYYPEIEWNEFQNTIANLKAALDDNQGIDYYVLDYNEETREREQRALYLYTDEQMKEITTRFHEMLYAYNSISDKYYVMGDINRDGETDVFDSVYIQKKAVAEATIPNNALDYRLTNTQYSVGDVNGDNRIDILDAVDIQKFTADKISEFKPYVSFITKINTHETEDFMKAHLINYDICPLLGAQFAVVLSKSEYLSMDLQGFYTLCEMEGIDY